MSDLLGIIAPLRKFLSNARESITITANGTDKEILFLPQGRQYCIPDFQREIRWDTDNVALLIDDLESGPKFLGNVILTEHTDNSFSIIDGQQRITTLTMILCCIKSLYGDNIDVMEPCLLAIESFPCFDIALNAHFSEEIINDESIILSDKLHQRTKYYNLWNFIYMHPSIQVQRNAKKIIENLGKSKVNIILNKSDAIDDGIRYFIDVNLKGKQLDTEDIFKSYLFKNDSSKEIRNAWYQFKTSVMATNESQMNYPLLKFLEHYFYCDLYKDSVYKGMEFGEDFLLKKEFKTHNESSLLYRKGIHLIELIDNKKYMLDSICKLNKCIEIMLEIVNSSSPSKNFESYFYIDGVAQIRHPELNIMHNLIGKILKDKNILSKALVMKYILTIFLGNSKQTKEDFQKIYAVYVLSVLFAIFESKKSKDVLLNVLKANDDNWYTEAMQQITSYFSPDKITDARLLTQYKLALNEEEENFRFRCKSLATIYNFFTIRNCTVKVANGKYNALKKYITDNDSFSTEHLIITDSRSHETQIMFADGQKSYKYDDSFYKKHVNSLFNFIFIPQELNSNLNNSWLPHKLKQIDNTKLKCDYSKMLLKHLVPLSEQMEHSIKSPFSYKDDLDLFFARDFKDLYVAFARSILKEVINKIKS